MRILALDLAERRIGWAKGDAGSLPKVGVFELRGADERLEEALPRLGLWLVRHGEAGGFGIGAGGLKPQLIPMLVDVDLVLIEDYVPLGAMAGRTTAFTQEGAIMLNACVRTACGVFGMGVPVRAPNIFTVRKHFCGRATATPKRRLGGVRTSKERDGDRKATKAMVIKQAHLLGYIPRDCHDDDMADACALYDFGSSYWARKSARFALTETV
jgi:hypothetical protein